MTDYELRYRKGPGLVTKVLGATAEQNLDMIADSVAYLAGLGRKVVYDAEHFFDGTAANQDELNRRSSALKRDLPRPVVVNTEELGKKRMETPSDLVAAEVLHLLMRDAAKYPVNKKTRPVDIDLNVNYSL